MSKIVGETSAILTDVSSLQLVLAKVLAFYGIVHEHHNLEERLQKDLDTLFSCITKIMADICCSLYCGDQSANFKTCKVHAHSHLARDIREYGSSMNYDASKGERGLKKWAKGVSKKARKCGKLTFLQQTAERVCDILLLDKVKGLIKRDNVSDDNAQPIARHFG